MASALKWEAVLSAGSAVAIGLGTTLANNTMSAAGTEIDNGSGLNTLAWLELTTSDSSALFDTTPPGAGALAAIYMTKNADGTTYEDAPLTGGAGQEAMLLTKIPIPANTTGSRIIVGPIQIPPCKFKLYLDGLWQAAAVLTAEWELNIYTDNLEGK